MNVASEANTCNWSGVIYHWNLINLPRGAAKLIHFDPRAVEYFKLKAFEAKNDLKSQCFAKGTIITQ